MTFAGGTTYGYSSENLLTSSSGGASLAYDPALRLYQVSGGTAGTQRFGYDGTNLIAEYNGSNAMLRRYVFGPGVDEPIVWYEGSGTTDRRFLHQDERGTVVAVTNSSGTTLSVNTFDEYGKPGSSNSGRFQHTGQAYLPEVGLYYYKARMYASGLGRFMQTDPLGYADGMNDYAYVHADPTNLRDPTGNGADDDPSAIKTEIEPHNGNVMGGPHSYDGLGMYGRVAGGLLEAMQFDQQQAALERAMQRLNEISSQTGLSPGCLLNPSSCTSVATIIAGGLNAVNMSPCGANELCRRWVSNSDGAVVQNVWITINYKNGQSQHIHFVEGWERISNQWTPTDYDLFHISGINVVSFRILTIANWYPGQFLPPSMLPGQVRYSVDAKSSSSYPYMGTLPTGPTIDQVFSRKIH